MRVSVASHVGLVRERNEDNFCVWRPRSHPGLALLAVADGLGGHRAGEVASSLALATLQEHLARALAGAAAPPDWERLLVEGLRAANRRVHLRSRQQPGLRGMGTTATALLVADRELFVGHVGDSRAYLVRGGEIVQLTNDHLVPGERHMLARALGVERRLTVDSARLPLEEGDVLVLATDGLTDAVGQEEILEAVRGGRPFASLACRLVRLANERGGRDNVTVVVAAL